MKRRAKESETQTIVERVSERAQEFISSVTKDLCEVSKSSSAATMGGVVFFPYGIQLIHLKVSVGPDTTPLVALDLEISGLKGDKGAQGAELANISKERPIK